MNSLVERPSHARRGASMMEPNPTLTHIAVDAALLDCADCRFIQEAKRWIDDVVRYGDTHICIVHLNPTVNSNLLELIRYASEAGAFVETEVGPFVTRETIEQLAASGMSRIALSLGPFAQSSREMELSAILSVANDRAIETGLQTVVCRENLALLPKIAEEVARLAPEWWTLSFPTVETELGKEEIENTIERIAVLVKDAPFGVQTQYAPFFFRVCWRLGMSDRCMVHDERNGLFVSSTGEIMPDRAIPVVVGHVNQSPLTELFNDHPLLRALRDPESVEGKCGFCQFRRRCGGSRARAYTVTGSLFTSDPACSKEAPGDPI